jgi:hypothetical protein
MQACDDLGESPKTGSHLGIVGHHLASQVVDHRLHQQPLDFLSERVEVTEDGRESLQDFAMVTRWENAEGVGGKGLI